MQPIFLPAPPNSDFEQRLGKVPSWAQLSTAGWDLLAPEIGSHEISAGTLLLQEGDECEALLLVESGDIRVYRQAEN